MNINLSASPCSTIKNKTGGWRTYRPETDLNICIGCGTCSRVCPEGIITMETNKEGKQKPSTNYDFCKGCGVCAAECPVKAIKMVIDKK
jgi:pyruvate ferredoxin oxidoreductase delta subunit